MSAPQTARTAVPTAFRSKQTAPKEQAENLWVHLLNNKYLIGLTAAFLVVTFIVFLSSHGTPGSSLQDKADLITEKARLEAEKTKNTLATEAKEKAAEWQKKAQEHIEDAKKMGSEAYDAACEKIEEAKEGAKEKLEEVKEGAKEKVEDVKQGAEQKWEGAKEKVSEVKDKVIDTATNKAQELKEKVKEIPVSDYLKKGGEYLKEGVKSAAYYGAVGSEKAADVVADVVEGTTEKAKELIHEGAQKVEEKCKH